MYFSTRIEENSHREQVKNSCSYHNKYGCDEECPNFWDCHYEDYDIIENSMEVVNTMLQVDEWTDTLFGDVEELKKEIESLKDEIRLLKESK